MSNKLPARLRKFFWEYNFSHLSWKADRDLILARVLEFGDWNSLRWLRQRFPDAELRTWLIERRGADLSARHLRFWELILKLPHRQVSAWIVRQGREQREVRYMHWNQQFDFWSRRNHVG